MFNGIGDVLMEVVLARVQHRFGRFFMFTPALPRDTTALIFVVLKYEQTYQIPTKLCRSYLSASAFTRLHMFTALL